MHLMENFFRWKISMLVMGLEFITGSFLAVLRPDLTLFMYEFPAVGSTVSVFRAIAISILGLGLVWGLFKSFFLPIGIEADPPFQLLGKTIVFMFLAWNGVTIVHMAISMFGTPYDMIRGTNPGENILSFADSFATVTVIAASSGATILLAGLFGGIIMLVVGWNFIKLIMVTVERYIVLGLLTFTSPLAFAMGASSSTVQIFKAWCRMVGGQVLLILLNVWVLRLFMSMMLTFAANPTMQISLDGVPTFGGAEYISGFDIMVPDGGIAWDYIQQRHDATGSGMGSIAGLILWMFFIIGFLKVAQRLDNYVSQLGLNAAQTGGRLGGAMLMSMVAMKVAGKALGRSGGVGGGGGAPSGGKAAGAAAASGGTSSPVIPTGGKGTPSATPPGGKPGGASGATGAVGAPKPSAATGPKPPPEGRKYNALGRGINNVAAAGRQAKAYAGAAVSGAGRGLSAAGSCVTSATKAVGTGMTSAAKAVGATPRYAGAAIKLGMSKGYTAMTTSKMTPAEQIAAATQATPAKSGLESFQSSQSSKVDALKTSQGIGGDDGGWIDPSEYLSGATASPAFSGSDWIDTSGYESSTSGSAVFPSAEEGWIEATPSADMGYGDSSSDAGWIDPTPHAQGSDSINTSPGASGEADSSSYGNATEPSPPVSTGTADPSGAGAPVRGSGKGETTAVAADKPSGGSAGPGPVNATSNTVVKANQVTNVSQNAVVNPGGDSSAPGSGGYVDSSKPANGKGANPTVPRSPQQPNAAHAVPNAPKGALGAPMHSDSPTTRTEVKPSPVDPSSAHTPEAPRNAPASSVQPNVEASRANVQGHQEAERVAVRHTETHAKNVTSETAARANSDMAVGSRAVQEHSSRELKDTSARLANGEQSTRATKSSGAKGKRRK